MQGLYLDGVNDLTHKLEEYGVDTATDCCNVKRDVCLRITIFVHTALTMIRTIGVQFFRGTANLLGGIIHFDGERIAMGLNDYFSLLIQSITLPILGLVTFVLPKIGYKLLHGCRAYCDTARQVSEIVYQHEQNQQEAFHEMRRSLSEAIMGILGSLTAFINTFTTTIEYFLSLNVSDALETVQYTGKLIAISPLRGCSSCYRKELSKEIFTAHRMVLESLHPSSLF